MGRVWAVAAAARRRARRHPVEERGVGVAGQDVDERGGPKAEGRPATRAVEGQRVERLERASTVIAAPGVRARASRYDSRPASSSASSVIR